MAEFSIIRQYFQSLTSQSLASTASADVGIGDDCAVTTPPQGMQLVSCVDTLVAGRHFPLDTSAHAIGWKSVAVNLSDLAAMGATAHSILLALSLPKIEDAWLTEFSRGIAECCKAYNVQLIGGDTTQSQTLTVSITALGWIQTGQAILRSGAQVGDLIVVSGEIGSAAYALRHPNSTLQATLDYPQPQLALGQSLVGFASSMIDISDGLAQDLGHILSASQVGAEIQVAQIPVADELAQLTVEQHFNDVLAGGDDYQLCFTISPDHFQRWQAQYAQSGVTPVTVIGQIQQEMACHYFYQNQKITPKKSGYQHFA
ncbi:thiamine-phosphate kinase [Acinetobacter sedimenti]|uniref:thiamine-phosphate kinase n=1 Tax=Acinetobacter sedimenti TaxID=2919922 RepID=UPI002AC809BC|nr:thiamine-phosphate kinase [Acinetobacter sedimenti]